MITLLLEATPSGQRLYEKLGYVVDHETWTLSRSRVAPSDPVALDHERRAIFELDRDATGSPRDVMIGGESRVAMVARQLGGGLAQLGPG